MGRWEVRWEMGRRWVGRCVGDAGEFYFRLFRRFSCQSVETQ